jgi:hypothetical protein
MSDGACLPHNCPVEPLSLPSLDERIAETQRLLARFYDLSPAELDTLTTNFDIIADALDDMAERKERGDGKDFRI